MVPPLQGNSFLLSVIHLSLSFSPVYVFLVYFFPIFLISFFSLCFGFQFYLSFSCLFVLNVVKSREIPKQLFVVSYPQMDLLERSVVGCESAQSSSPDMQPLATSEQASGERDKSDMIPLDLEQYVTCHELPAVGASVNQSGQCFTCVHVTSDVNLNTPLPGPARNENSAGLSPKDDNPSANTPTPDAAVSKSCATCQGPTGDVGNTVTNSATCCNTNIVTASVVDADYPIRGTISPLTSKVAVKRSVGPVDEVSFVFGRPASPTSEQVMRCGSPQTFVNPGIARCMSPSPARYIPGHYPSRPRSPSSDVLPRRRGVALGAYPDRRVLSPPPLLGVGAAAEPRIHHQGGICCEHCNGCLVELKRQALRLMFPDNGTGGHLAQVRSTFVFTSVFFPLIF